MKSIWSWACCVYCTNGNSYTSKRTFCVVAVCLCIFISKNNNKNHIPPRNPYETNKYWQRWKWTEKKFILRATLCVPSVYEFIFGVPLTADQKSFSCLPDTDNSYSLGHMYVLIQSTIHITWLHSILSFHTYIVVNILLCVEYLSFLSTLLTVRPFVCLPLTRVDFIPEHFYLFSFNFFYLVGSGIFASFVHKALLLIHFFFFGYWIAFMSAAIFSCLHEFYK